MDTKILKGTDFCLESLEFEIPQEQKESWIMRGKPDYTNSGKEFYYATTKEKLLKYYKKLHGV